MRLTIEVAGCKGGSEYVDIIFRVRSVQWFFEKYSEDHLSGA
jgi:hypothetical protein